MAGSPNVHDINDSSFDTEVLKSGQLTLVDFWAEWCGPCKALTPTITALADQFAGKLKVVKVNVDENPNTPSQYRIRGIPTLLFFKGGQMVDQLVGNHPKDTIAETIQRHL
jgi:thioredoxin 1